jgi:hypothetical protein
MILQVPAVEAPTSTYLMKARCRRVLKWRAIGIDFPLVHAGLTTMHVDLWIGPRSAAVRCIDALQHVGHGEIDIVHAFEGASSSERATMVTRFKPASLVRAFLCQQGAAGRQVGPAVT